MSLARRAGDPAHTASALRTLARVLLAGETDRDRAMELLRESLTRSLDLGDRPGMIECLETVAGQGDALTGAQLMGAAEAARAAAGAIRGPDEAAWVEATTSSLRSTLGEEAFEAHAPTAPSSRSRPPSSVRWPSAHHPCSSGGMRE